MKFDKINKAAHYNQHPSGVECIDVVKHMNFCTGNAIKYLWRSGLKDTENPIDDLRKAAYYINCEIARLDKKRLDDPGWFDGYVAPPGFKCPDDIQPVPKNPITKAYIDAVTAPPIGDSIAIAILDEIVGDFNWVAAGKGEITSQKVLDRLKAAHISLIGLDANGYLSTAHWLAPGKPNAIDNQGLINILMNDMKITISTTKKLQSENLRVV